METTESVESFEQIELENTEAEYSDEKPDNDRPLRILEEDSPLERARAEAKKAAENKANAKAAIEAILFTLGDAVELPKIADAVELDKDETKSIIEDLQREYDEANRGMKIIELDGAYQMCTRDSMYDYLIRIAKQPKRFIMTDVLLETLSIIAYKQPVTKNEIEKIRGVSCDHSVNKLMEYNLVKEVGRLNVPGRPILLGTTEEFLRSFGLSGLDDLPEFNQDMVNEFKSQAEQEVQLRLDV
ncbi:MAG: SMC-Scp complex subunit ScpB [Lachnospiraceae bacterium]|nr:SMC-Scp complex subunit ScpB [Lachnospiraceae bacterium]